MKLYKNLVGFELKKILKRKIIWITMVVTLAITAFAIYSQQHLGGYYINGELVDSNYNMFQKYQKYARTFSAIWNFVRSAAGMTVEEAFSWQPDEGELYALREKALEEDWKKAGLSQAEKEYWKEKEGALEIPVTFFYKEGYWTLLNGCSTVSIMVLLSVAIGLSNMFPEEHVRKTDQLILSSLHGRRLYWAKLTAGAVFGVGMALLHFLFALGFSLLLCGADGFDAVIQLIYPRISDPISVGEAVFLICGQLLVMGAFISVCVMIFSELCRNSIAALAAVSGLLLFSMFFEIPEVFRTASQIWSYVPQTLYAGDVFDSRLVSVFGFFFTKYQFLPIIYTVLAVLFAILGKLAYNRQK